MPNIANNYSSTIITIFKDVIERYENNVEIIKQTEGELQDVLHEIELGKSQDLYGGYKLYKQIKELRMTRRQAKDENALLENMYNYFKSQPGQAVKSKMQSIQSSAAKEYDYQQKRTYTPRQRDNLSIEGKTCQTKQPFEDMLKEFKKNNKVSVQNGKLRK